MKTLAELRKIASELKIKNYCKFTKEELNKLIDEKQVVPFHPILLIESKVVRPIALLESKSVQKEEIKTKTIELPREGTQSREIYGIFEKHLGHKKWTVYRVTKDYGYSLNNVRRIYKKYFEERNKEIFANMSNQI